MACTALASRFWRWGCTTNTTWCLRHPVAVAPRPLGASLGAVGGPTPLLLLVRHAADEGCVIAALRLLRSCVLFQPANSRQFEAGLNNLGNGPLLRAGNANRIIYAHTQCDARGRPDQIPGQARDPAPFRPMVDTRWGDTVDVLIADDNERCPQQQAANTFPGGETALKARHPDGLHLLRGIQQLNIRLESEAL